MRTINCKTCVANLVQKILWVVKECTNYLKVIGPTHVTCLALSQEMWPAWHDIFERLKVDMRSHE